MPCCSRGSRAEYSARCKQPKLFYELFEVEMRRRASIEAECYKGTLLSDELAVYRYLSGQSLYCQRCHDVSSDLWMLCEMWLTIDPLHYQLSRHVEPGKGASSVFEGFTEKLIATRKKFQSVWRVEKKADKLSWPKYSLLFGKLVRWWPVLDVGRHHLIIIQ